MAEEKPARTGTNRRGVGDDAARCVRATTSFVGAVTDSEAVVLVGAVAGEVALGTAELINGDAVYLIVARLLEMVSEQGIGRLAIGLSW